MNITIFKNDLPANFMIDGDIAIDTETMGLNLARDRLCVLQFSNGGEEIYLVQFDGQDYKAPNLKRLLLDNKRIKIFHFARFDLQAIKIYLGLELDNIFCTKICSKLVRTYTDYHGLKELCRELLGVQISKQQQSSYWGAATLSPEQQEYAAKDVYYLHKLKQILKDRLIASDRLNLAEQLFAFLKTRVELDIQGWQDVDIFSH